MKLSWFFVPRLRDSTKEAFVADAIQFTFQHQQLLTYHHATEAIKVAVTYQKNMSIVFDYSSNKGAH
jgi:ABC-type lipoprotein export system ATPase subunit